MAYITYKELYTYYTKIDKIYTTLCKFWRLQDLKTWDVYMHNLPPCITVYKIWPGLTSKCTGMCIFNIHVSNPWSKGWFESSVFFKKDKIFTFKLENALKSVCYTSSTKKKEYSHVFTLKSLKYIGIKYELVKCV